MKYNHATVCKAFVMVISFNYNIDSYLSLLRQPHCSLALHHPVIPGVNDGIHEPIIILMDDHT